MNVQLVMSKYIGTQILEVPKISLTKFHFQPHEQKIDNECCNSKEQINRDKNVEGTKVGEDVGTSEWVKDGAIDFNSVGEDDDPLDGSVDDAFVGTSESLEDGSEDTDTDGFTVRKDVGSLDLVDDGEELWNDDGS